MEDKMMKICIKKLMIKRKPKKFLNTITKLTTLKLQPLDVGIFRMLKIVRNRFQDYINLEQIQGISLKNRNNIMDLWSLIFNQFNSAKFINV